jgi:hypothetical protein
VAVFCKHCSKPPGFVTGGKSLDHLNDFQLLKNGPVAVELVISSISKLIQVLVGRWSLCYLVMGVT